MARALPPRSRLAPGRPPGVGGSFRGGPRPLLGVVWDGSLGLVRVNPDTLRAVGGSRVAVAGDPLGWSFSPTAPGSPSAQSAGGAPAARGAARPARARRRAGRPARVDRGDRLGGAAASARGLGHPRVLRSGQHDRERSRRGRRRVLWHRKLGGSLQAGERLDRGVVLVLGPRGRRVGPSRIVLVGPRGGVRSASLPGIRSGSEPSGTVTHRWDPGWRSITPPGEPSWCRLAHRWPRCAWSPSPYRLTRSPQPPPTRWRVQRGTRCGSAADCLPSQGRTMPSRVRSARPGSRWWTPTAGPVARSTREPPMPGSCPARCSPRRSSMEAGGERTHRLFAQRDAQVPPVRERPRLGRPGNRPKCPGRGTARGHTRACAYRSPATPPGPLHDQPIERRPAARALSGPRSRP